MPRLPDAQSLSQVRTDSLMPVAAPRGGDPMAEASANLGRVVQGLGVDAANYDLQKRDKQNAYIQRAADQAIDGERDLEFARARSHVLQKNIETQGALEQDPDYGTYVQRYSGLMKDATAQAAEMISDPRRKALFQASVQDDVIRGAESLRSKAYVMGADSTLATMKQNIIANNTSALAASDPVLKNQLLEENHALIDAMHRQYPDRYSAVEAFKDKQDAAVNGYALPSFSTRPADQQLDLIARKLGYIADTGEQTLTDNTSKTVGKAPKPLPVAIREQVETHAARRGLTPAFIGKVISIENPRLDPAAVSPTGVVGFAQITKGTGKEYGVTDHKDVGQNIRAMADILADRQESLTETLGRPATEGETYLAYQQGLGGAKALLKNPNANAVDALTPAYKGDRDKARQAVVANGGKADMTASEFSNRWITKFDTTSTPGFQGAQTGTEADIIPWEQAQKLYEPAAQSAFYSKVDSDPQGAMAMLNSPAFSRIPDKTKTEWRNAARTAFKNQEENAAFERVMDEAGKNTNVWNAYVGGTLQPDQLTQLQATGQVSPDMANFMRAAVNKSIPKRTPEEIAEKISDITDQYTALGIQRNRKNGKTKITSVGNVQDFAEFQRNVINAAKDGYLANNLVGSWLNKISMAADAKINKAGETSGIAALGMRHVVNDKDPDEIWYAAINSWMSANNMQGDKKAKGEILRRYALAVADNEEIDRATAAADAIKSYRQDQYPVLRMIGDQPNAIMPKAGGMALVMPGASAAKPQVKVNIPAGAVRMRDKTTGIRYWKLPDGTFQQISDEGAAPLQATGQ